MNLHIHSNPQAMGQAAAEQAATILKQALSEHDSVGIIVATGASQFETLNSLVALPGIDWSRVEAFHLDEYVGLPESHPASFRKYLKERFVAKLPAPLKAFHEVNGDTGDPHAECQRLGREISRFQICLCLAGIGENAHLAFNDPPADFDTQEAYLVVDLDDDCRRQQLGEGWFPDLDAVPAQAISMSIQQILKSKTIIISCPDERKAQAVQGAVEGPVTNLCPSSILQQHEDTTLHLDEASASLLNRRG